MKVSVVGGSGYVGGELLRLLINHPKTEIGVITSEHHAGEPIYRAHPNLRGTSLKFETNDVEKIVNSNVVFTALPHGKSREVVPQLLERGVKVVDLGADFRLKDASAYEHYYGFEHNNPDLLQKATYGLPELHRDEIRDSNFVSVPGCMATAAILALAPLVKSRVIDPERIVIDAKIGSSGSGSAPSDASHHSERSGGVRVYKATGHRHIPEIEQELRRVAGVAVRIGFTPHAVGMVRGILSTSHTFTVTDLDERDVWKIYRASYGNEPFVRMVSDKKGPYGLPNPKVVVGTNFCDIGFEMDDHCKRLVVFSAIDNLTKGAAGQAVQCCNLMTGLDERTGLGSLGLHP
jgi:N-acetyl-gamma-glutamyl-phosphate/LysW-gamma-L-alpha-aminoadipyl-6-phosphate reductase